MTRNPTVVVVGCPNSGKSTLINRLTGTRQTVVDETPGVTRDRKVLPVEWRGFEFDLIDTGGFDAADTTLLAGAVREQVIVGIDQADLVLFVVDAQHGPLPGDFEIAEVLRRSKVPVLVLANKVDDPDRARNAAAALHELGIGDPVPVSALHGVGTGDLLDDIVERLRALEIPAAEAGGGAFAIPVAIVGRPNAGKSTLFNAIVGERRTIVGEQPGTTRDAIDTEVDTPHGHFVFVDTAGMRKAAKVSGVEYYSYLRSLQSLERAHVAVVVTDATVGLGELDISIAAEAAKRGCATVVALNKCDLQQPSRTEAQGLLQRKLRQRPPLVALSALTGRGVSALLDVVAGLESLYTGRIPTAALNRAMAALSEVRGTPARGRRHLKAYYITQYATAPPRFAVDVNDRTLVTRDYGYFVENRLRAAFGLEGVPVIVDFKSK